MTLKRSEIKSLISLNLGNRTSLDDETLSWMNFALHDIASMHNWREMLVDDRNTIKTVAGLGDYAPPPNTKDISDVRYVDDSLSKSLIYKTPVEMRKQFSHPESDGYSYPVYYTWDGEFIRLYPWPQVANKNLWVRYFRWPDDFSDYTDEECPIPRAEQAIIALATAYGYEAVGEMEKQMQWKNRYLEHIHKIIPSDDGVQTDHIRVYGSQRMHSGRSSDSFVIDPIGKGNGINTTSY